jgi:hypothetical protein
MPASTLQMCAQSSAHVRKRVMQAYYCAVLRYLIARNYCAAYTMLCWCVRFDRHRASSPPQAMGCTTRVASRKLAAEVWKGG